MGHRCMGLAGGLNGGNEDMEVGILGAPLRVVVTSDCECGLRDPIAE